MSNLAQILRLCAFCWLISLLACTDTPTAQLPSGLSGKWLIEFDLKGSTLPVEVEFSKKNGRTLVAFLNGDERIVANDVVRNGDSVEVTMPLYDSKFFGKIDAPEQHITGHWINYVKGDDYIIPFTASAGEQPRFPNDDDGVFSNIDGKWEVDYQYLEGETGKAIGLFNQVGDHLEGTFLTETGDYRYLEGGMVDNHFQLSCFDGSHAFLFSGTIDGDSIVDGTFTSGTHWSCTWTANRNEAFELTDADSLTYLKEGYDMVDFTLPNLQGDTITLADERFQNKVVLVQIMGSWCPNCADETAVLCEIYNERHDDGLEVVALAFEKNHESVRAKERVQRMIDHFGVKYDVLMAGPSNKAAATKTLPFLDNIISYPTCIFIDRTGNVRKIRAGFSGPGTGEHYTQYVKHLELFVDDLLSEGTLASE